MILYRAEAHTEVHNDASKLGISTVLMQTAEDERNHPVAYFSRKTTHRERIYHSYELEILAVVETLKKFIIYLLRKEFVVITDCNAIRAAQTKKDLVPQIARWWLTLSEFTFQIQYRPGIRMAHVDALSRNPASDSSTRIANVCRV